MAGEGFALKRIRHAAAGVALNQHMHSSDAKHRVAMREWRLLLLVI